MKRYLMIFLAAAAASVSCHKEPVQGPQTDQPQYEDAREVTIEAGILSKTVLADDNKVKWEGGDEIALVFHHSNGNHHVNKTFANQEKQESDERAVFKGLVPNSITEENGYNDLGFAVYPNTAIQNDGTFSHNLPAHQKALADESTGHASFESGLNLSSAAVALSEMGEGKSTKTDFRSALSVLKLNLTSDIKSVTITGTAPLAGTAPLQMHYDADNSKDDNNGRLLIAGGAWIEPSTSVTLKPDNAATFVDGTYNILVWPGTQEGLSITVDFVDLDDYVKVSSVSPAKPTTFKPAKYYTLNFKNTEELVVEEVLVDVENNIPNIDDVESDVNTLLAQIQSVSLMTEYLDNAVNAKYSIVGSDYYKKEIELNYMVRPVEVAEKLVDEYSDAMSALVSLRNSSGNLDWATLPINGATLSGDIMTVKVNADAISKDVYDGTVQARMALQIASSATDIVSDFAKLHPLKGAGLYFTKTEDIPVMRGAQVSIPLKYAPNGDSYSVSLSDDNRASFHDNAGLYSGYIRVNIADSDLASQTILVTLTSGDDVIEQELTFVDAGKFDISYLSTIDYPGGEVNVSVDKSESYGTYTMTLSNTTINTEYESKIGENTSAKVVTYYNTWIYEKNSGVSGTYMIDENGPKYVIVKDKKGEDMSLEVNRNGVDARTAYLNFEIKNANPSVNGDLTYNRSISITQKPYGTDIDESLYYTSGTKLTIKTATSKTSKHLNLVILGDGYKKAHLLKTGVFEGRARYAADVFLNAIDPDFRDRFNVYAIVRESSNAGIGEVLNNGGRYTYYETYKAGTGVNASDSGKKRVKDDVASICSKESFDYYRTVAIVLVNTDINAGASDYEFGTTSTSNVGDGYTSFGYCIVPAYSTGTGGLIRHEVVGHCFGRLGDEYYVDWYNIDLVNTRHGQGFYRNIATDQSYWSAFTTAGYTADEVDYIKYTSNGNVVDNGLYRSKNDSGIMFNNNGTFNAVSRWAIYERIRKQTEGNGNYWNDFLKWDQKNR